MIWGNNLVDGTRAALGPNYDVGRGGVAAAGGACCIGIRGALEVDVAYAVARERGGVVPTLGITCTWPARGAPHPGHHRTRHVPGCGYHARGPGCESCNGHCKFSNGSVPIRNFR